MLLLGDPHLAEDAVQSALLKAWRHWSRIGGVEHVEAYVRRILLNTVRSDRRRRLPAETPGAAVPERAVADTTDVHAERDAMWRRLQRLPARQRAVLVLRFYEDMSEAQTAIALGCHVGTVKSYTARAMAALRADEAMRDRGTAIEEVR